MRIYVVSSIYAFIEWAFKIYAVGLLLFALNVRKHIHVRLIRYHSWEVAEMLFVGLSLSIPFFYKTKHHIWSTIAVRYPSIQEVPNQREWAILDTVTCSLRILSWHFEVNNFEANVWSK